MKHLLERIKIQNVSESIAPPTWEMVFYDDKKDKIEIIRRSGREGEFWKKKKGKVKE